MANKEVAPYNDRAISLKQYLSRDDIKRQLFDAAPKILNGERFLKVFYGACLRNPRILECTTESLLQAAMFFSQLGLEPILGRAYLVPYLNSKNVDGRWVKQYEVQAQVGYQGLVDLARRSDTIADVWGASVYENDIFDLTFGMERTLIHKPWFMDPGKRKDGEAGAGACIGAYVVWQLKDGTKHPEFMPIHEINKRRAKSQSWNFAEFGDPQKGGGKKDSVWHQWPEDMQLKTVIKHSSKLVPASIEFMEAIAADDATEAREPYAMSFATVSGPPQLPEPAAPSFDAAAQAKGAGPEFEEFVKATAEGNRKGVDQFKAEVMAAGRFAELWAAWEKIAAPKQAPAASAPQPGNGNGAGQDPAARENWIKLRGPGYAEYVKRHIAAFRSAPSEILAEARGKWMNIYGTETPWPLDEQPAPAAPAAPAPLQGGAPAKDPMAGELAALQDELKRKAMIDGGLFLKQAQLDLKMPVGVAAIPTTIDACRALLERVEDNLSRSQSRE